MVLPGERYVLFTIHIMVKKMFIVFCCPCHLGSKSLCWYSFWCYKLFSNSTHIGRVKCDLDIWIVRVGLAWDTSESHFSCWKLDCSRTARDERLSSCQSVGSAESNLHAMQLSTWPNPFYMKNVYKSTVRIWCSTNWWIALLYSTPR